MKKCHRQSGREATAPRTFDKGQGAGAQPRRGGDGGGVQLSSARLSSAQLSLSLGFCQTRLELRAGKRKQANKLTQHRNSPSQRPECPRRHGRSGQNGLTGHQISATKEHYRSETCTRARWSARRGRLLLGVSFPPPCFRLSANLSLPPCSFFNHQKVLQIKGLI